jgi:hypothetical protein
VIDEPARGWLALCESHAQRRDGKADLQMPFQARPTAWRLKASSTTAEAQVRCFHSQKHVCKNSVVSGSPKVTSPSDRVDQRDLAWTSHALPYELFGPNGKTRVIQCR